MVADVLVFVTCWWEGLIKKQLGPRVCQVGSCNSGLTRLGRGCCGRRTHLRLECAGADAQGARQLQRRLRGWDARCPKRLSEAWRVTGAVVGLI